MPGKQHFLRYGSIVVLCLLSLCLALGSSVAVQAAAPHANPQSVQGKVVASQHISSTSSNAARSYWTSARMKAARSADVLTKTARHTRQAATTGKALSHGPVLPQGQQRTAPKTQSASALRPSAYPLPPSYYSYFPYSTIGKVFFTDSRTGGNYVCSGTVVNSNNLSVVDTAGHCVVQGGSGGNWYTNWVFCPQYYYGSCPAGVWTARQLWSYSYWVNNGWLEEDYGAAVINANWWGTRIVNAVGGTGWAANYSRNQYFYAFGYPAAYPFDGNTLYYCPSPYNGNDYPSPGNAPALYITCNMTGGSSGGGWLISINGTFGYVNGHNDYKYTNDAQHMYSPYYGNDWYAVFNAAQNS